jgi:hypothetical protein
MVLRRRAEEHCHRVSERVEWLTVACFARSACATGGGP